MGTLKLQELRHWPTNNGTPAHHHGLSSAQRDLVCVQKLHHRGRRCGKERRIVRAIGEPLCVHLGDAINIFAGRNRRRNDLS